MNPRQPRVTGDEVVKALQRGGWYFDHQRGSHVYLRHPSRSGLVSVPVHAGEIIKPKTMRSILDQAGLSADELRSLL